MNARARIRIAASLPWLATFGCGGPHAGETKHPVAGSIPLEGVYLIAQDAAPRGMSADQAARWKKVRAMLMDAKTALSLGVAGDEGPETFGSIATGGDPLLPKVQPGQSDAGILLSAREPDHCRSRPSGRSQCPGIEKNSGTSSDFQRRAT